MFVNSKKIAKLIEEIAPLVTAESWDNVGFQVGNKNIEINRIMVALEITEEVLDEAINKNIDLIVTHHPLIFGNINKVTTDNKVQEFIIKMIKNNINLYVAHTNIDASENGTNMYLAKLLNLNRVSGIDKNILNNLYKISVFVPVDDSDKVRDVLFKNHAGKYKYYDNASFSSNGMGTFRPLGGSNPYIGNENVLENVKEVKIEVIIDKVHLDNAIRNMIKVHPYEVVAYDVIKLENYDKKYSIGITGYFEKSISLDETVDLVKNKFGISNLKLVHSNSRKINKIAICSGVGSEYIKKASKLGCNCLITGDIKYHEAQYAKQLSLNIIDAGHFETENIYMDYLENFLRKRCFEKEYDISILKSEKIVNPFEFK